MAIQNYRGNNILDESRSWRSRGVQGGIGAARACVAEGPRGETAPEEIGLNPLHRSGSGNDVQYAIEEQSLRVWPATCPEGSVRAKILMDKGDLDAAGLEICENLAPRACGQARAWRTRMGFRHQSRREFPALSTSPEVSVIEQPPDLGCGNGANRRRRHVGLARTANSGSS